VWGDDEQTRSFLYIDEFMEGTVWLLRSVFPGPINIESEGRGIFRHRKEYTGAPRITDSPAKKLYWEPLYTGLELTYQWIEQQVSRNSPYSATTQPGSSTIYRSI
jgi:hypothetical protein